MTGGERAQDVPLHGAPVAGGIARVRFGRFACALVSFGAPILAVVAPLGLAPLASLFAVVLAVQATQWLSWRDLCAPGRLPLLMLGVLASLSVLWSGHPAFSLLMSLRLAGLLVLAAIVWTATSRPARAATRGPSPLNFLVAGLWIACMLLAVALLAYVFPETAMAAGLPEKMTQPVVFKRAATVLAILAWPAVAHLWAGGRRRHAVALSCAVALAILLHDSISAKLALTFGMAAWAGSLLWQRRMLATIFAALAIGFLLLPVAAFFAPPINDIRARAADMADAPGVEWIEPRNPNFAFSGLHRLAIWRFAAGKIAEKPLLGWGFETSRFIAGPDDVIDGVSLLPLHPHNAALQIWLELGALGIGVTLLGLRFGHLQMDRLIARRSDARDRALTCAAAAALLASAGCIAFLSYGVWQEWWISALILAFAAWLQLTQSLPEDISGD